MQIDSHQHFWRYNSAEYPWIRQDWPIRRDYLPGDLKPLLDFGNLSGSIAVQARQTVGETRWLLELAECHSCVKAVVGWVDLRSEKLEEQLEEFVQHPKFAGVRHVVQDEPDDRFLLSAAFMRGIRCLANYGMTYDLLVFPRQLPAAIDLVSHFPQQPFVLDHIAKPPIKEKTLSPWKEDIGRLARYQNVLCKVSGLMTEAKWQAWSKADFNPYLDVILQAFGPERIMFGSDWPVCLLSGSYEQALGIVQEWISSLPGSSQQAIMGGTAEQFYLNGGRGK